MLTPTFHNLSGRNLSSFRITRRHISLTSFCSIVYWKLLQCPPCVFETERHPLSEVGDVIGGYLISKTGKRYWRRFHGIEAIRWLLLLWADALLFTLWKLRRLKDFKSAFLARIFVSKVWKLHRSFPATWKRTECHSSHVCIFTKFRMLFVMQISLHRRCSTFLRSKFEILILNCYMNVNH